MRSNKKLFTNIYVLCEVIAIGFGNSQTAADKSIKVANLFSKKSKLCVNRYPQYRKAILVCDFIKIGCNACYSAHICQKFRIRVANGMRCGLNKPIFINVV